MPSFIKRTYTIHSYFTGKEVRPGPPRNGTRLSFREPARGSYSALRNSWHTWDRPRRKNSYLCTVKTLLNLPLDNDETLIPPHGASMALQRPGQRHGFGGMQECPSLFTIKVLVAAVRIFEDDWGHIFFWNPSVFVLSCSLYTTPPSLPGFLPGALVFRNYLPPRLTPVFADLFICRYPYTICPTRWLKVYHS